MRALLMAIVVLGLALVAGDRVAVIMAQNEIGRKIAAEYNLQRVPSVVILGFPVLTQGVDGRYSDVRIQ
ncbi:LmeA family phospholipid-binding protein, partial [Nocardia cerradoensis]|uniref:LmeA family phospholipid-binding protein n=1 Tax=Nocardia cerradoensis TaxID=85688 RepID=UPI00117D81F4